MSRAHVTEEEERKGFVLACRSFPSSDVRLAVVGKMRKTVCRVVPDSGTFGVAASAEGRREVPPDGEE